MDPDFVLIPNVPIFDENEEYDAAKLETIVANNNRRVEDTGDASPVVIGHTDPTKAEHEQPEVIGYAVKFRLGTIGKVNPRRCIYADFQIKRDKAHLMEKYPRRSVELWKDDLYIDPISLLGANTPRRDLGLLYQKGKYSRDFTDNCHTYNGGSMVQEREEMVKQCVSQLLQCAEIAYVRDLMAKSTAEAEAEDAKDEAEEQEAANQNAMTPATQDESKPDGEPAKNAEATDTGDKDKDKDDDSERMAKEQLAGQVERFRREAESMKAAMEEMGRKLRRSDRERDLVQMEVNEGIMFDRADELDSVTDMNPEAYQKHLTRMRKNYQRAPIGINLRPAPVADFGGPKQFTRQEMEAAVDMAVKNKVTWEEALKAVKGN